MRPGSRPCGLFLSSCEGHCDAGHSAQSEPASRGHGSTFAIGAEGSISFAKDLVHHDQDEISFEIVYYLHYHIFGHHDGARAFEIKHSYKRHEPGAAMPVFGWHETSGAGIDCVVHLIFRRFCAGSTAPMLTLVVTLTPGLWTHLRGWCQQSDEASASGSKQTDVIVGLECWGIQHAHVTRAIDFLHVLVRHQLVLGGWVRLVRARD